MKPGRHEIGVPIPRGIDLRGLTMKLVLVDRDGARRSITRRVGVRPRAGERG